MNAAKRTHNKPASDDGSLNDVGTNNARETEAEPKGDQAGTAGASGTADSPAAQLQSALAERDANHDKWIRAVAELDNYRKRVQRENEETRKYQAQSLVRDLLPVLDNLRRAVAAATASDSSQPDELIQGVELVLKQLDEALTKHAIKPIPALGQPFDPHLHEAVQQVPSDEHPPMTIVHELERGYTLYDRVIRPSKVVVSSGLAAAAGEPTGN